MYKEQEIPVNAKRAREILGFGSNYMSAIKRAMNIRSRYFYLSDVRKFLRDNPTFTSSQFYHRTGCGCPDCILKREKKASVKNDPAMCDLFNPQARANVDDFEVLMRPRRVYLQPETNELALKFRMLRGKQSSGAVAKKARIATESVRRIEHGGIVKLKTLRQIADCLEVTRDEWLGLVVAWLKFQAGDNAKALTIEIPGAGCERDQALNQLSGQTAEAMALFERLNLNERGQILFAMQRREVLGCLAAIQNVVGK